ncbi:MULTISPECIES: solute:sodium symporter family transporter [Pseudomonas]|jgi:solute:Na+ symporter, SSS family|uniref:Solute:sodium symporter family transporter n=2 Tax=Pseudomonas TaxID=286 RepID=A0A1L7NBY3_PSEPU|nr:MULTISPECIES: solute:sodium symporter family transporter [Pseudomonas]ERT17491.2 sodium transporter [Pseudomonas putida SJ3]EKT4450155.1 solute:sodium symporter family transporter [Pseudomonas putida]MBP2083706.1 SSS family solute:Na+ symporter [Pseudomonas sp. PvP089]MBP2090591.1 SSS family solute:Na+ symporter [Pseudomonas sp. PvP088]MBP2223245.1 SSS family solute:Na+ symporter [Pseudomonas putida]
MSTSLFTFLSMLFFTVLVAVISYRFTRQAKDVGAHGYFMASGGLNGWFIAGSMMLTNLSIDQLVGLNGDSYAHNLSSMAWEATAAVSTIALALFFLPRYLRGGFSTLPEFIEKRYDRTTRRVVSALMVATYTLVLNPASLYLGAITFNQIFDLQGILGWSYPATISLLIVATGVIGAAYAVLGGLRAVAVSDTINGIGLLVVVILIPIIGLWTLGQGDVLSGAQTLLHDNPQKLNAIGGSEDKVPFGAVFTGMIFANLFYWCTNQAIVQKSMAARNLAEGQKGVLLSGCLKLLVPLAMLMPGVIAWHLFRDQPLANSDLAYPALVAALMPWWMKGFFVAVIFGTVMSHFNAIINGTATLLTYDFYKSIRPMASDEALVRFGKRVSVIAALVSLVVAPMLMYTPEGIYAVLRRFTGFFNMPIIAIMLFGFFSARGGATPAKLVLGLHAVCYAVLVLGLKIDTRLGISFIHVMGIMFAIEMALLVLLRKHFDRATPYVSPTPARTVDLTPWRHAGSFSVVLFAALVSIYLTFSPLGVARVGGPSGLYLPLLALTWLLAFAGAALCRRRFRHLTVTHALPDYETNPR